MQALPDPEVRIKIILKDPDFLVVDKPPGMACHPLRPQEKGTLIQGVLAQYPEISNVGYSPRDPGLLHRLDNDTSGLVLIARNQNAFEFLKNEFQKHRVEKRYLAWVEGGLKGKGKIEFSVAHHPKSQKKMQAVTHPSSRLKGREAVTFYEALQNLEDSTLVEIQIPTGVRHQIRVHLAAMGYPIVGDVLYGGKKREGQNRFFLHAHHLKFRHPKKMEWVSCESGQDNFKKLLS